MTEKKYFTLEEANQLIPVLEKEMDALRNLNHEFQTKVNQLNKSGSAKSAQSNLDDQSQEVFIAESKLEFIEIQARLHVQNIEQHGCLLKDVEVGLVDFPALIDGEEILLCWKYGEKEIAHYHGADDGYKGRKPLE
ncbi:DUF2203 domain-containing protein [Salisediminibacterium beveridgei]|uniref:Cell division protein DivIVA n=1 Tax=Salisediminibacterium beveridgei TaxID=632773 RepID=A0A1D7QVI6_9BACI|nr:DUF2203 domain-containing protein [Salisediminibacterium beveridgei]AOM83022.1 hypothetical protein BBEV_1661 [Salisediminibacterium beveridgei]